MITIAATDTSRAPRTGHPDDLLDRAAIVVTFHGVERRYGDVTALAGLDLTIRTGETVALLGPNGAGKSTAIGLMLGLSSRRPASVDHARTAPRGRRREPAGSARCSRMPACRSTSASASSSRSPAGSIPTPLALDDSSNGPV